MVERDRPLIQRMSLKGDILEAVKEGSGRGFRAAVPAESLSRLLGNMREVSEDDEWDFVQEGERGKRYYTCTPGSVHSREKDWPKFRGKRGENVNRWYRAVMYQGELEGMTQAEIFRKMKSLLVDDAREWVLNLPDEIRSNSTRFAAELQKEFGVEDSRFLEVELKKCRQEEGETVREFMRRLKGIAADYPGCSEEHIRAQFEEGLRDPQVKREVLIHSSGRLEDVLAKAVRAEKALQYLQGGDKTKEKAFIVDRKAQDKKETPFQQQLREMREMIESLQQEVKGLRGGRSTQGGRPSLQSGRSGQYPRQRLYRDRRERDQEGRPICYRCKQAGHIARNCTAPLPVEESTQERLVQMLTVEGASGAGSDKGATQVMLVTTPRCIPLQVPSYIGGIEETVVLDSGSSLTMMAEADYLRLRREERIPPMQPNDEATISGIAEGVDLQVIGKVTSEIEFDGHMVEVTWKVVKDAVSYLVLGNDSLLQLGVVIDYNKRIWSWRHGEPRPFNVVQDQKVMMAIARPERESGEKEKGREVEEECTDLYADLPELIPVDQEEEFRVDTTVGDPNWGQKPDSEKLRREIHRLVEEADLSIEEKQQLERLLLEYEEIFVDQLYEPGRANYIPHAIDTGDHPPIYRPPFRISPKEKELIRQEVAKMLKAGVIRPSQSPWGAPVIIVQKKDGGPRFCTDFRLLNKVTKRDRFPLPRIDDLLDSLGKAPFRSTFDLASGYWQIAIREEDKEKTAFVTPDGLYEYNVLPMGVVNAPSSFQRNIYAMLGEARGEYADGYMDDLVAYSATFPDHLQHLREVFERVKKAGLKIKVGKCHLVRREMPFLGHVLKGDKVYPDPAKIEVVEKVRAPKNRKELQRFLGLSGYYRRFVEGYASIAEPLTRLLKKDLKYEWAEEQQRAFEELKKRLTSQPVLSMPDWSKPFILQPDASGVALGAVLSQKDDEGREHVVRYASRVLSPAEKNYSATERELLAIVWGAREFRPYLFGNEAIIETDHKALTWLAGMKNSSSRLTRWALLLQEYSFTVKHKAGKKHTNADALSREPFVDPETMKVWREKQRVMSVVMKEIAAEQREDLVVGPIIAYLEYGELPDDPKKARRIVAEAGQMYLEKDGRLFRLWWPQGQGRRDDTRRQLVVPPSLRKAVMRSCHDDLMGGHLGLNKAYTRMRERYWWPTMYTDMREWIETCESCQAKKNPKTGKQGELEPIPVNRFLERVGIDLVGPLPVTPRGNKYLLTISEYLSGWPEAWAIKDDTAATVARYFVEEWICRYGAPEILTSDRGRQFLSDLIDQVCRLMMIDQNTTTSYHPATNGKEERWHQTWAEMTSRYLSDEQTDWDLYVPYMLAAYRFTIQNSAGDSPYFLMFGREPYSPLDITLGADKQPEVSKHELVRNIAHAHELAKRNIQWAQGKQKEHYDSKRVLVEFKKGDLVLLHVPVVKPGRRKKFTPMWKGPFVVIDRRNSNNYLIRSLDNERDIRTVHVERMKPYRSGKHPTGELEVQEVLDERIRFDGSREYLIRWRGLTPRFDEWVPANEVHAKQQIDLFHRRNFQGNLPSVSSEERNEEVKEKEKEIEVIRVDETKNTEVDEENFEEEIVMEPEEEAGVVTLREESREEAAGPSNFSEFSDNGGDSSVRRSARLAKPGYKNSGMAVNNEEIREGIEEEKRRKRERRKKTSRTK